MALSSSRFAQPACRSVDLGARVALQVSALLATVALASLPMACGSKSDLDGSTSTNPSAFRAVAAACAYDWQCASGVCSTDEDGGGCGVCLEVRRLGEACDGPLLTCSATAACTEGICHTPLKIAGEACHVGPKGESSDCDADFHCAGSADGMGVCTARSGPGGPCVVGFGSRDCFGTDKCERGVCSASRQGGLGDSCDERTCEAGLSCHDTPSGYTCEKPNLIPEGDPCGYDIGLDCVAGAECEGTGGPPVNDQYPQACLGGRSEGEECASNHCAEGLVCEEPEGERVYRCQRLRSEGEACRYPDECASGLECRSDHCMVECR